MIVCKASDCSNAVPSRKYPGKPREYCSDRCRDREKQRRYRKESLKRGICPQCRKRELDFPISLHKNKTSPKYCSECQRYFRERYRRNKTNV